ncbi:MAG: SRPBCC domain-containing protein [Flavobacteriaceae bacterium]|nr:MAG: SRPBCC domain-containing protein [Flavobacteriaceae bacterium]
MDGFYQPQSKLMYCIKHQIQINSEAKNVYVALTSIEGLSEWWTHLTSGSSEIDGIIEFKFDPPYGMKMKVISLRTDAYVKWECIQGEPDWIGTIITFDLEQTRGKTTLRFKHDKWPTQEDFYAHCNLSWAKYLLSLRSYIETGKGQPFQ